jgi:hypothetical protein
VTEVKAKEFSPAINNANLDFGDPGAARVAVQALVDEIHDLAGWTTRPNISASVTSARPGHTSVTWNLDLTPIGAALGTPGNFNVGLILCGLADSNRTIWSAARSGNDLYVPPPVSKLIGNKLAEAEERLTKTHDIIDSLEAEVDFPDVQSLVNSGQLDFGDVLKLRRKADRFRRWLQTEGARDRNALIAYHHEVAKEAGFIKGARTSLRLFGAIGGAIAGQAVSPGLAGAAIGAGLAYVGELAAKLGENWRPVIFGEWARDFVAKNRRDSTGL